MKACVLFLIAVALSGCGAAKTCIDGVTYLQFTSGATVQVDRTGKPVQCS